MQPGTGPHTVGRRFCAVQAFLRSKNLGAGAIHLPRAFEIPKGRGRLWRPEPKKKDTTYVVSFFLANPNTIDALKMGNDFMRMLLRTTHIDSPVTAEQDWYNFCFPLHVR